MYIYDYRFAGSDYLHQPENLPDKIVNKKDKKMPYSYHAEIKIINGNSLQIRIILQQYRESGKAKY